MARRAPLPAILLAASLLANGAGAKDPANSAEAGATAPLLLGKQYPIESSVGFPAALLHWLDSLAHLVGAGWTGGKTVAAHRQDYMELLGRPTEKDQGILSRYRDVRVAFVNRHPDDRDALTRVFFEAESLEDALSGARTVLDERDRAAFEEGLLRFEGAYRRIWKDGAVPRGFVEASLNERRRKALARFLIDVAEFFQVEPDAPPRPRLVLTPVRAGFGTHAQAIDQYLLIEVRPGEKLLDQVAPIVHENAHLLFYRMPPERLEKLSTAAATRGPAGQEAWQRLKEALPTAIAQGVAQAKFRPDRWSFDFSWYHLKPIDAYAKSIFPVVKQALATGRTFDAELVEELVNIYAGLPSTAASQPNTTPRSP